jgi:hypothetical protein
MRRLATSKVFIRTRLKGGLNHRGCSATCLSLTALFMWRLSASPTWYVSTINPALGSDITPTQSKKNWRKDDDFIAFVLNKVMLLYSGI